MLHGNTIAYINTILVRTIVTLKQFQCRCFLFIALSNAVFFGFKTLSNVVDDLTPRMYHQL
jgi:hypothetical protein